MSNKTFYIVDFDGTILETTKLILKCREEICKENHVIFDPSVRFPSEFSFLKSIFSNLTLDTINHFIDLQIHYSHLAEDINFKEVADGLNLIKENTIVVTKAFKNYATHILSKNNFDFNIISVTEDKDEVFKQLINSNSTFSKFVFIGDSINDLYFDDGFKINNILVTKDNSFKESSRAYKIYKPFNKESVLKLKNYLKIQ